MVILLGMSSKNGKMRPLGPILGTPWVHLGDIVGHLCHLTVILGSLGAILGRSWAILGLSWAHLGPSWAYLGPSWGLKTSDFVWDILPKW